MCFCWCPEQFTLADRARGNGTPVAARPACFMIDVMSPSRLSEQVLASRRAGSGASRWIAAGRRMALSQALERLEDKLPYYGSHRPAPGLCGKAAMR